MKSCVHEEKIKLKSVVDFGELNKIMKRNNVLVSRTDNKLVCIRKAKLLSKTDTLIYMQNTAFNTRCGHFYYHVDINEPMVNQQNFEC